MAGGQGLEIMKKEMADTLEKRIPFLKGLTKIELSNYRIKRKN